MITEEDLLYNAIGRFAVDFEKVTDEMRSCIMDSLESNGLGNREMGEVIVADLSADPLRRLLGAIFYIQWPKDTEAQRKVSGLLKRIQVLTSVRNRILHGRWDIGDPFWTDDISVAEGLKLRSSEKQGLVREWMDYKAEDFDDHTSEAERLVELIRTLRFSAFRKGVKSDKVEWIVPFDPKATSFEVKNGPA